jgi:iron complex transport system substrate-binding protein
MVDLAGGEPVLGTLGAKSVRTTWEDVHAAAPDVVVVAPCGFDRAGAQRLADEIGDRLPVGVPVHAVDANASWARPGPRLLDGIEELAAILDEVSG